VKYDATMPAHTGHLLSDIFTIRDFISGSRRFISVKNIFLSRQIVIYQGNEQNVREIHADNEILGMLLAGV
jgi:hypothetical protein